MNILVKIFLKQQNLKTIVWIIYEIMKILHLRISQDREAEEYIGQNTLNAIKTVIYLYKMLLSLFLVRLSVVFLKFPFSYLLIFKLDVFSLILGILKGWFSSLRKEVDRQLTFSW